MSQDTQYTGFEIAVIGMAGRFPGAANLPEYWRNLQGGVESVSFLDDDELAELCLPKDVIDNPLFVRSNGGALENKEYFDAALFGYTPNEAQLMDPQLRLLHECGLATLNDASYDPFSYKGLIGFYAGVSPNFYWEALANVSGKNEILGHAATSYLISRDYVGTRVAYKLNLMGQAVSVNTACSTSLVAIHMACRGLLSGECDIALAGGATVLAKHAGYVYQDGMIMSPDGHCRAFDEKGMGTVTGEGVGLVALKPLEDAMRDNDHIYAVIKGSACNNDGLRKVGFTAPSIQGQMEVIRAAMTMAEISPESISYIEAHGTGTTLGDPTEIEALTRAFNTDKKGFCRIGAVKSSIGHLDAAAGVAGFVKTVLALQHRQIPPTVNYDKPNPRIDFENSPFRVATHLDDWENGHYPRRAGVSSFGIGGTNAHVILEEAPGRPQSDKSRKLNLICLSAATDSALKQARRDLAAHLKQHPDINLTDVAYSLQTGRRAYNHRCALLSEKMEDDIEALTEFDGGTVRTFVAKEETRQCLFMFPGQGSQYQNMGSHLYQHDRFFKREMDRCFELLQDLVTWNPKAILYPAPVCGAESEGKIETRVFTTQGLTKGETVHVEYQIRRIDETEVTQPILFVIEYALAKTIMSWGIQPRAMIGHSLGEFVAACLAGVFSLEDALKIVVKRGKLMQGAPTGSMVSVSISEDRLKGFLTDDLSMATVNGPTACVVAGPRDAVEALSEKLHAEDIPYSHVHSSHAFHSKLMDSILDDFSEIMNSIELNAPTLPFISCTTGNWITVQDATDPAYWQRHLRHTVRFADGLDTLLDEDGLFLEVGPGRTLSGLVRQNPKRRLEQLVVNLLPHPTEEANDARHFVDRVGQLWLYGVGIDWQAFYSNEKRSRLSLPHYPFESQRFWLDGDLEALGRDGKTNLLVKNPSMDDWFYLPSWRKSILAVPPQNLQESGLTVLVLSRSDAFSHASIELLRERGHRVVTVASAKRFRCKSEYEFELNPRKYDDFVRLLTLLKERNAYPHSILYLLNIGQSRENDSSPSESLGDTGDITPVIALGKAISTQTQEGEIAVTLVTTESHEVIGEEHVAVSGAGLFGPLRVLQQELPFVRCRNIDITVDDWQKTDRGRINDILTESFATNHAFTVAYRNGQRWVQTYESVALTEEFEKSLPIRDEGVYVITGGLGQIGLTIADMLLRESEATVVLLSRTGLPESDEWANILDDNTDSTVVARIREVKELKPGDRLHIFKADVAEFEELAWVFSEIEKSYGRIAGVFHAAGDMGPSLQKPVGMLSDDDLTKQWRPKVNGVLNLSRLLEERQIDFCMVVSSLASVLGGMGFAGYSAANIQMDAIVNSRRRSGQPWLCVNLDGWDAQKDEQASGSINSLSITPAEGKAVFRRLLGWAGAGQVVVSTADLTGRLARWVDRMEIDDGVATARPEAHHERPPISSPYVAPETETEKQLVRTWENIFGFRNIGILDDFFELGGDSLKAIATTSHIHKELNVNLPLAEFLAQPNIKHIAALIGTSSASEYSEVVPAEQREYYPLTSPQLRLFFHQDLTPQSMAYNEYGIAELRGKANHEHLGNVFKTLIQRHEGLRTIFLHIDGQPAQRILTSVDLKIDFVDISEGFETQDEEQWAREIRDEFVRPFDLSQAPLFRVALYKIAEERYWIPLDIHHIISDGVSYDILWADLVSLYLGSDLPELPARFSDYAASYNTPAFQNQILEQKTFWQQQFEKGFPRLDLPVDFSRKSVSERRGERQRTKLGSEMMASLREVARDQNTTPYMVLLAAFNVLLAKISGQEDVVVGTTVAGRRYQSLKQMVGMFVNTIVLRNFPQPGKTFKEFMTEVQERAIKCFDRQDYPFESLVAALESKREVDRHPVFDVMFVTNAPSEQLAKIDDEDSIISLRRFGTSDTKLDLACIVSLLDHEMVLVMDYCADLFKDETIAKLMSYYALILETVLANVDVVLSDIEIFSKAEADKVATSIRKSLTVAPSTENAVQGIPGSREEDDFDFDAAPSAS